MALPDSFYEELLLRTESVELVRPSVALNQKGDRFWGLCPFHSEKTPSFSVSRERGMFYCFGCGTGGTAIQFLMKTENLPFIEAVRELAERAGLHVPDDDTSAELVRRREAIFAINRAAAAWFHDQLTGDPAHRALNYLTDRAIKPGFIKRFGLGYAPDRWDGLLNHLTAQNFNKADIQAAGLSVDNKKGGYYDRFRGRLMFPIIDLRQKVIGFGGRVLDDSMPKYLNSPETPVFSKSRNLFALNLAKKSSRKQVILAEGYMDVIALHQAGFDSAVASLGTALTEQHARVLATWERDVVIAYDMDTAGRNATDRAVALLRKVGVQARILTMKDAKDPDEYIRRFGRDAFEQMLTGAESHIDFKLNALRAKYDLTNRESVKNFVVEATQLLIELPSAVERSLYTQKTAELCALPPDALLADVNYAYEKRRGKMERQLSKLDIQPARQVTTAYAKRHYRVPRSAQAEEELIALLFADGSLLPFMSDKLTPEQFTVPLFSNLFALALSRYPGGYLSLSTVANDLEAEAMSHLVHILEKPRSLADAARAIEDSVSAILSHSLGRGRNGFKTPPSSESPDDSDEAKASQERILSEADPLLRLAQTLKDTGKGYGGS